MIDMTASGLIALLIFHSSSIVYAYGLSLEGPYPSVRFGKLGQTRTSPPPFLSASQSDCLYLSVTLSNSFFMNDMKATGMCKLIGEGSINNENF